jgi:hypothetical protein
VGEVDSLSIKKLPCLAYAIGKVFSRLENDILLISAQLHKTDCFLMLGI